MTTKMVQTSVKWFPSLSSDISTSLSFVMKFFQPKKVIGLNFAMFVSVCALEKVV
jgi:hypothetical protein